MKRGRCRQIAKTLLVRIVCAVLVVAPPAEGATWSQGYIGALPDEAFAVVEVRPDATRARHLPHHSAERRVDLPHLRAALGRLHQVRWADPVNAARAWRHLLEHFEELGGGRAGEVR